MTEQMELHKFLIGEIRTDGWKSPWRIEQERRRAEDATKFVGKPIVHDGAVFTGKVCTPDKLRKPMVRRLANDGGNMCEADGCTAYISNNSQSGRCREHRYIPTGCNPKSRYKPVVWTKHCEGCSKGLRASAKGTMCQPCLRARPKCPCGKTIYLNMPGPLCAKCANRKHCMMCPKELNENNRYGLCKVHYIQKRRTLNAVPKPECRVCAKPIRRHTFYGLCREHARPLHSQAGNVAKKQKRSLKEAA